MMNNTAPEPNLDKRLRTMRILWGAFIWNVGLLAFLVYMVDPPTDAEWSARLDSAPEPFPTLLIIFFALGVASVGLSFVLKSSFMKKAVSEQRAEHVQTGMIVALVLCEVAALLGFMVLFINGNRYAYLLFVVSVAGQLPHFPRREQLLAASYKSAGSGGGSF